MPSGRLVLIVKLKQISQDLAMLVEDRMTANDLSYLHCHKLFHLLHLNLTQSIPVVTITHEIPLVLQRVEQTELL